MRIVVPDPGATITSMPHDAAWASEAEAFAEAVRNAEYGPDGDWRGHVEPGASTDLFERVWDEQAGAWLEQRPELYSDPSLVQADADDLLTKSLSSGPSFAFPSELVADETPVPQERSEPVAGPAVSAAQSPRQAQLTFLAFLLVAASMFAVGWLL